MSIWCNSTKPRRSFVQSHRKIFLNLFLSLQVFEVCSSGRPNLFRSLRLARAGAICQGVHTSGSLTMDGRHRVRAYMDRWHCRRVAQRCSSILVSVLEYLARSVRRVAAYEKALSSLDIQCYPTQRGLPHTASRCPELWRKSEKIV